MDAKSHNAFPRGRWSSPAETSSPQLHRTPSAPEYQEAHHAPCVGMTPDASASTGSGVNSCSQNDATDEAAPAQPVAVSGSGEISQVHTWNGKTYDVAETVRAPMVDVEREALMRANASLARQVTELSVKLKRATGEGLERGTPEHLNFHRAAAKMHIMFVTSDYPLTDVKNALESIAKDLAEAIYHVACDRRAQED